MALDGMPLAYHNQSRTTKQVDHILLPPGGRVEAIVIGPPSGSATLTTRCVDTGTDGDANPSMIIANVGPARTTLPMDSVPTSAEPAVYKTLTQQEIQKLESTNPDFVVTFTEDKNGFYVNGQKFSMQDGPMLRVRVGSMQHWRILNATNELHPFHIHQVHFLAYAQNGVLSSSPEWLDTHDGQDSFRVTSKLARCAVIQHDDSLHIGGYGRQLIRF